MARGGMETFVHVVVGWSALVVLAARPLKKGWLFFSLVRVNDEAEAPIKNPTRQIDRNLTSTFQLAMVERVLGALVNAPGSCGEEEAVVGVLSSGGVMSVGAGTAELVLLRPPTIGQPFGGKISCVWVAMVRW